MSLKIYDGKSKQWKKATSMLAMSTKIVDTKGNYGSENVEGCLEEIADNMKEMQGHIKYIYQNGTIGGGPGIPGASVPTIKLDWSADNDGIYRQTVKSDEEVIIYYYFNSPNPGMGTVRLASGDKITEINGIKQGMRQKWNAGKFPRGTYNLSITAEDQQGFASEPIRIEIISGAIEITSSFSDAKDFSLQDFITIPYKIQTDMSDTLTAQYTLDGKVTEQVVSKGDRTWSIGSLGLGVHKASIKIYSEKAVSNQLNYNIVMADSDSLFISTSFAETTFPQGKRLQFDYRISMKGQTLFTTELYLDGVLVNTKTDLPGVNFWDLGTELSLGVHSLRIVAMTQDKQVSDTLEYELEIVEAGLIEIIEPTEGMIAKFNASGKMNGVNNSSIWEDKSSEGPSVNCTLHGFNYKTNGWLADEELGDTVLKFAGKSYAEIDLKPFENGLKTGFTFDILYKCSNTGNTDARVVECKNPISPFQGFMIDTEKAVFEAKQGARAFYGEDKWVRKTFTVDRLEKTIRVYTNAIMCGANLLPERDEDDSKDEFIYNGKILLGAGLNANNKIGNNSTSSIKMIRIYNRALSSKEIVDLHMFDIKDADELNQIYDLNYGALTMPTLVVRGTGIEDLTPDSDPLTVNIQYDDPLNPSKKLERDFCALQIQGTTSAHYPIKNYTLFIRDQQAVADRTWTPKDEWMPEERWTLKTNFMDSSFANNVGMAKFAHDLFKENPYPQQVGEKGQRRRATVDGFPVKVIINGANGGIYTFNIDRYAHNIYGLSDYNEDGTISKVNNAVQYEIAVNSTEGAGAFKDTSWDSIRREFKHRYNYRNGSATVKVGNDVVLAEGMHSELVKLIEWVSTSNNDEFRSDLHKWFSIPHLIDYYLTVYAFGMIDNFGKNMVLTTFGQNEAGDTIWYPSFYDMDSILGLANNGEVRYDAGIDMDSGNFNTSGSALWTKLRINFEQQIQNRYYELRAERVLTGGQKLPPIFSMENVMTFLDGEVMSKIGQSFYNTDLERKYLDGRTLADKDDPDAPRPGQTWIQCCNGDRKEFTKRWISERFMYLDSVFQTSSYSSKTMILRTEALGSVTLKIKSYSPQWFRIKYTSANEVRVYASRDRDYEFTLNMTNDKENDFTIYGADNLMYLSGMELLQVSHINISGATKLTEINCTESKNIKGIKIGTDNKYLQKVLASQCPSLGVEISDKAIDLRGCPNLKEVNLSKTMIKELMLPTKGGVIEILNCENSLLETFDMSGQEYLEELQLKGCSNLSRVFLADCNGLKKISMPGTILTTFSIARCNNIESIDISNTAKLENLDLSGCPNLKDLNLTGVASSSVVDLDLSSSLKLEKLIIKNMPFIQSVTFGRYVDENDVLQNFNALKHFDCANSTIRAIRYGNTSAMPTEMNLSGLTLNYITFENCPNISSVKGINLIATDSMSPFKSCRNLVSIEGNIKLKKSISQAFWYCSKLTNIDANIKAGKLVLDLTEVTGMSESFYQCSSLTLPDIAAILNSVSSKWTGESWRCFNGCTNAKGEIPETLLAKATGATQLNEFFMNCTGLRGELPANLLSKLTNLGDCEETFRGCTGLTGAIPEGFFAGPGQSLRITKDMFTGCTGLEYVPDNNLFKDNPNIQNCSWMFNGCTGITGKLPGEIFKNKEKLSDIRGFFNGCSGVWGEIPRTLLRHMRVGNVANSKLAYVSNLLRGTSVEGEIPRYVSDSDKGIFDELPYLEDVAYMFPVTISGTIPPQLFKYNPRLSEVSGLFNGCTLIEGEIPEGLLAGKSALQFANELFMNCTGLNSPIPRKLFEGCTLLTEIASMFNGCKSISGQIPARTYTVELRPSEEDPEIMEEVKVIDELGLFDYCTSLRKASHVFAYCEKISGNIPPELFAAGNLIEDLSGAFVRCFQLTGAIPGELFANCKSLEKVDSMFSDCCGLGRSRISMTEEDPWCVPPELFEGCRGLISAGGFLHMWGQNKPQASVLIGQVPPTLFRNNRKLRSLNSFFAAAPIEGVLPGNLFITNSELVNCENMCAATKLTGVGRDLLRNHKTISNVTQMFWQSSEISGEVPDLWTIGGLIGTSCYKGLSSLKVTNWNSIPDNWKL